MEKCFKTMVNIFIYVFYARSHNDLSVHWVRGNSVGEDNFKLSIGFFEQFKKRENTVFYKLHRQAAEADTLSRKEWHEDHWGQRSQEYTEKNIWNANESGICFRVPDRNLKSV